MKYAKRLLSIFYVIDAILFTWIYIYGIGKSEESLFFLILMSIGIGIVLFTLSYKIFYVSEETFERVQKFAKIGCIPLFFFQVFFAIIFRSENTWGGDFDTIIFLARECIMGEGGVEYTYLAIFENNILYFLLVLAVFSITYFLTGECYVIPLLILNVLILDLCIWGIYKLTTVLGDRRQAFMVVCMCFCFSPYWFYLPIAYTDIFSMPFFVFPLLWAVLYEKNRKQFFLVLIGVFGAIGYWFKGTPIIATIAVSIFFALTNQRFKAKVRCLFPIITTFTISVFCVGYIITSLPLTSKEEVNANKYPITHWIYMGLVDEGRWNADVVGETSAQPTYEDKKEYTKKAILDTLSAYGVSGTFMHITEKEAIVMYNEGTLNASRCILRDPVHSRFVSSVLEEDSPIYALYNYYSQGYFRILLVLFIMSLWLQVKKSDVCNPNNLLYITAFGVFLFYALWEVNSRYLVNSVFVFIVIVGRLICEFCNKFVNVHRQVILHKKGVINS